MTTAAKDHNPDLRILAAIREGAGHVGNSVIDTACSAAVAERSPVLDRHYAAALAILASTPQKLGALFANAPSVQALYGNLQPAQTAVPIEKQQPIDWDEFFRIVEADYGADARRRSEEIHAENASLKPFQVLTRLHDESLHEAMLGINLDEKME